MLVIHGEDSLSSRKFFLTERAKAKAAGLEILDINGSEVTYADLDNKLASMSLFADVFVCIENLFTRRASKEKDKLIELLATAKKNVLIWEDRDVTQKILKLKDSKTQRFDLPKYLFAFLDKLDLVSLHNALKTMPAEVLLASVATRLRKRIMAGDESLVSRYQALLEIDYKSKTANMPYTLDIALELWVLRSVV
jgi:hypothetical protein